MRHEQAGDQSDRITSLSTQEPTLRSISVPEQWLNEDVISASLLPDSF